MNHTCKPNSQRKINSKKISNPIGISNFQMVGVGGRSNPRASTLEKTTMQIFKSNLISINKAIEIHVIGRIPQPTGAKHQGGRERQPDGECTNNPLTDSCRTELWIHPTARQSAEPRRVSWISHLD
jgi:hypothetical protein